MIEKKLDRIDDFLRVNEQNVRNMYKMISELKEEMTMLKVQTNRIESTINEIQRRLDP